MLITQATEYAGRCVLYLASQEPGRIVPSREIAGAMEIPAAFLAKIAQRLARAGIVRIVQGARGGCQLLVAPRRLTLLAVLEAAEGEIGLNKCVLHPEVCARSGYCPIHTVWDEARRVLRESLGAVNFADLAAAELAAAARQTRRRSGSEGRPRTKRQAKGVPNTVFNAARR